MSPTGFEPVAPRLGISCSILLSYGDAGNPDTPAIEPRQSRRHCFTLLRAMLAPEGRGSSKPNWVASLRSAKASFSWERRRQGRARQSMTLLLQAPTPGRSAVQHRFAGRGSGTRRSAARGYPARGAPSFRIALTWAASWMGKRLRLPSLAAKTDSLPLRIRIC